MSLWGLWPVLVLAVVTGGVGVLSALVIHWWLEARALRPAYLADRRERIPADAGADTLRP